MLGVFGVLGFYPLELVLGRFFLVNFPLFSLYCSGVLPGDVGGLFCGETNMYIVLSACCSCR